MKKLFLSGIAALFLATGAAQAGVRAEEENCEEHDQRATCDNPTGWIAQCNDGDQTACKALNDLLAQVDDDERRPFEDRWSPAKWECALNWQGKLNGEGYYYYPDAYIEREDIPKIIKAFKEMKGHCAFLQCLDDRSKGKVKHCYANDRRWR
jgi:hypothetical protein